MTQLLFLLIMLLWSSPAMAVTYFVGTNGNDSVLPANNTSSNPWLTIQKCANTAASGDTCSVNSGTYSDVSSVCVSASAKCAVHVNRPGITFMSTVPLGAKISGSSVLTNLYGFFLDTGSSGTTIQGFEIFNFFDAGIFSPNAPALSNMTYRGNLIHDIGRTCTEFLSGIVGIFVGDNTNNVLIEGNIIHTIGRTMDGCSPAATQIRADHGIYADGNANLTIRRNLFYNMMNGFHIHLTPQPFTNLLIQNNTFADPIRLSSGQIIIAAAINGLDITNNIFYNPSAASSPCGNPIGAIQFAGGTGGGSLSGTVLVRNNLTTVDRYWYLGSCTSSLNPPAGVTQFTNNTVSTNPLFTNAAARNYSLAAFSPAIDTGLPLTGITCTGTCDKGYLEAVIADTTPPEPPTGLTVE
jgi:hypothetical protein